MDSIQIRYERAVGDSFIAHLNRVQKTNYTFKCRGNPAPDLVYQDEKSQISLEIVTSYYDPNDARLFWENARNIPDAPRCWSGMNFDQALILNLNAYMQAKCDKAYGSDCLLVIHIMPPLTTFKDMEELIADVKPPAKHSFGGIYLMGDFGISATSLVTQALWKLA
jgi:hypothetical protein